MSQLTKQLTSLVCFAVLLVGAQVVFMVSGVNARGTDNVNGYVWSENIGWVHMNGSLYGVNVASTGLVSGQAWSENIGWITFTKADLVGCPSGTCEARFDKTSGKLTGWARAVAGNFVAGDRWDGWIRLYKDSDNDGIINTDTNGDYGVVAQGCNWTGYAWGENVIGWVKFGGTAQNGASYGAMGTDANSCTAVVTPTLTLSPATTLVSKKQIDATILTDSSYVNSNKVQLQATYDPDGTGPQPSVNVTTSASTAWSSSNNGLATVAAGGIVTGAGSVGDAIITATYSGKSATAIVTVAGLTVTPSPAAIDGGGTKQFQASANGIPGTLSVTTGSLWSAPGSTVITFPGAKGLASAENVTASGIKILAKYALGSGRYAYGIATANVTKVADPPPGGGSPKASLMLDARQLGTYPSSSLVISQGGDVWMKASTGNVNWCALTSDLPSTITYPAGGAVQLNPMNTGDINDQTKTPLRQPVKLKAINLQEGSYTINLECMGTNGSPVSAVGLVRVNPPGGACTIEPVSGQALSPLKFFYPLIKQRTITFKDSVPSPYYSINLSAPLQVLATSAKSVTLGVKEPPVVSKSTATISSGTCTPYTLNYDIQVVGDGGEF